MKIRVEMEFSGDVEEHEMLQLAKEVLDQCGEGCYCETKVLKIEEIKGDK